MNIRKSLSIILVAMIVSIQPALVVAAETVAKANSPKEQQDDQQLIGTVKLTSGNLNIRNGPSTDTKIIGKLANHSKVVVLQHSREWANISHNGTSGFVSLQYLTVAQSSSKSLDSINQKIIVLDPGHGGRDPGAIAKDGTYESNLVWKYTTKAKELLEKSGYIVHVTRSEKSSCTSYKDIYDELDCRATYSEKVNADIFISIHADANPSSKYQGTVTFYNNRSDLDGHMNPHGEESKDLAQSIHSIVQPVIDSDDHGIKNKNYYVNRMNSVPSILIELGLLTNAADLKKLKATKTQDKVAVALVKAVDDFFGK